jgi:uncharacterized protein (TIGR02145 family)
MAQNVQYNVSGSLIYENDPATLPTHGRYYTWAQTQNVCPTRWHLPTDAEWNVLSELVEWDSKKLKSTTGWRYDTNGTDDYGFNGIPNCGGPGIGVTPVSWGTPADSHVIWWTATEYRTGEAYNYVLDYLTETENSVVTDKIKREVMFTNRMYNVRCVKD